MKRILLVDDDVDILDSLTLVLEESYEITIAKNGAEALKYLESGRFDAVVLDLMMPILGGEDVVRALAVRGIAVPVVLASAQTDLRQRQSALGVHDYIEKPFDIDKLMAKLARLLRDDMGGAQGGGGTGGNGGPRFVKRHTRPWLQLSPYSFIL